MTVDGIDVDATVKRVRELLAKDQGVSPALRSTLEVLLVVVQLLVNRSGLKGLERNNCYRLRRIFVCLQGAARHA